MKKWQCKVCNYIHTGDELPESCAVCGVYRDLFEMISDEGDETKTNLSSAGKKTYKCGVCGYIHREGDLPDKCPVCGVAGESFKAITSPSDAVKGEAVESDETDKKWKCTVCGYIHIGPTPPDKCPVCGADASLFVLLESDETESTKKPVVPAAKKPQSLKSTPAAGTTQQGSAAMSEPTLEPSTLSYAYATITRQMSKLHGHPISVHIPNGVLPVAYLFFLLGIIFNSDTLLLVSHYNLVFVLLAMPLVLFSGYNDWQIRLGGAMTPVIKVKMICGALVSGLTLILVVWHLIDPDVVEPWSSGRLIYITVFTVVMAAAAFAGFYGGKLIQFPGDDKL